MSPEEFVLWVIGLIVFALLSAVFVSAQSSDPPKVFAICLAIDCIVVVAAAVIGVACYAIAWAWRNPTVIVILVILGILAYFKYGTSDILPEGEKR
jgi:carbon starvation protein CstA